MKIFYSWQMDAPRKVNKDFIRAALDEAVTKLREELDVSEAERDDIQVDQDTQGNLGSPDIARVILEKIAGSRVVVCDVSLIGTGKDGKKHINSNVAIELGYTYGKLGDEAVLKIMNTHYGPADALPFDLRTRRRPVQYHLAPEADAKAIKSERTELAGELTAILRQYLAQKPSSEATGHIETLSTDKRGVFWQASEVIVPKKPPYVKKDIHCSTESVIYFRCIPKEALPPLSSQEAYDVAASLPTLLSANSDKCERNIWGAASYCMSHDGELMALTQLFKNREIWSVDVDLSNVWTKPESNGEEARRFIYSKYVQEYYPKPINEMREKADALGYGDAYTIEIGVSGAFDLYILPLGNYSPRLAGPIYDNDVFVRETASKSQSTGEILNAFWRKVFSEAGQDAPKDLLWSS